MTLVGTVGECAIATNDMAGWNTARAVAVIPVLDEPGALWVKYMLASPQVREWFTARLNTTVQATLNLGDVSEIPIPVPEEHARLRIENITRAFDDKIELNRQTSETLESMAQALFRSWFVDFDPVHAKAEGRTPIGMDADIAALFPSEFEPSSMGLIPKGWRCSSIGSEAFRCGGLVQTGPFGSQLHAADYVANGVPVIMPKDIRQRRVTANGIALINETDADRLSKHRVALGDIVYSRRGDVERHALIGRREVGWICGTGCLLVRLGPKWHSPLYASLFLSQPESKMWISQHAVGATMPNLNTAILSNVPILIPDNGILDAFNHLALSFDSRIISGAIESQTLAAVRETLTPRLLSGEFLTP